MSPDAHRPQGPKAARRLGASHQRPAPDESLDVHTATFGAALGAANRRALRRRRRARRGAAVGAPLVGAFTLAVALWPAERASVLDRATAALTPTTGVVHYRAQTTSNGTATERCQSPPMDAWHETNDRPRWRVRTGPAPCSTSISGLGNVTTGAQEQAFDGTNLITTAPEDGWVERLTNASGPGTRIWSGGFGSSFGRSGSTDPVRYISDLLADGKLRVEARRQLGGREAFELVGRDRGTRVRYVIDARTFAPILVERSFTPHQDLGPEMRRALGDTMTTRFLSYRSATERDLQPTIPPNARETTIDYDRWRAQLRAGREQRVTPAEERRAKQRLRALRRPAP